MIQIIPLRGIGEIRPGDPLERLLAAIMTAQGINTGDGDILVVTQKIVSKAEDRFVRLDAVTPGAEARDLAERTGKDPRLVELVLAESSAVVRAAPNILITRHRLGHVMANAGIDRSNIGGANGEWVLLLPEDPDRTAAALATALGVPVVISDSFGRPWRMGVVPVAIGAAGLPALDDQRGRTDRDGRLLEVTQVALADMVAAAAGLAMGEGAEGVPAALVRGLSWTGAARPSGDLVRPPAEDLFR